MTSQLIVEYIDRTYNNPTTSRLLKVLLRTYRGYGWNEQSKRLETLHSSWNDFGTEGKKFITNLLEHTSHTFIKIARNNIYTRRHKLKKYKEGVNNMTIIVSPNTQWMHINILEDGINYWESVLNWIKYVLENEI
jgi:hypothetical protein